MVPLVIKTTNPISHISGHLTLPDCANTSTDNILIIVFTVTGDWNTANSELNSSISIFLAFIICPHSFLMGEILFSSQLIEFSETMDYFYWDDVTFLQQDNFKLQLIVHLNIIYTNTLPKIPKQLFPILNKVAINVYLFPLLHKNSNNAHLI